MSGWHNEARRETTGDNGEERRGTSRRNNEGEWEAMVPSDGDGACCWFFPFPFFPFPFSTSHFPFPLSLFLIYPPGCSSGGFFASFCVARLAGMDSQQENGLTAILIHCTRSYP